MQVKICGITREADGVLAAEAGADLLGVIASQGYGRSVEASLGVRLGRATDLPVVAVTVDEDRDGLLRLAGGTGATILQLHGDEPPELLSRLREEGPWKLWKAVRVRTGEEVMDALERYGAVADGILLDGWHPERHGGAGVRFPWEVVGPVRDRIPRGLAFVAAGGLTPDNVGDAVRLLRPDVVDVSSGVESAPGRKDPEGVRNFVRNAKMQSR